MTRKTNDEGVMLIKKFEGLYLTAYHGSADRPGLLTIGLGHTDAAGTPHVTAGMTITEAEAETILRADLGKVEASVERMVKVPLNDNQFAALVSFVFNLGEGNFSASTLLARLNNRDYASIPAEFMKWVRANGVRVQGLANRRSAEAKLWVKPVAAPSIVPPVSEPLPVQPSPPIVPAAPPVPVPQSWLAAFIAFLASIFRKGTKP